MSGEAFARGDIRALIQRRLPVEHTAPPAMRVKTHAFDRRAAVIGDHIDGT